jgi:hypothetical protein
MLTFGFWILPLWLTLLYHPLRSVDTVTPPLSQGKKLYKHGSSHKEQKEEGVTMAPVEKGLE